MPLYYYKCSSCQATARKICSPYSVLKYFPCKCGANMERDPHPPTSQVVETLDNGLMPSKVTRLADAEKLFAERSKNTK